VWAADNEMRRRARPAGTVGGRIAGIHKPCVSSAAAMSSVGWFSPITSGWIAVCESSGCHGVRLSISRTREIDWCKRTRRAAPSLEAISRTLADTAWATAGGAAVVKI
jgi:hypothetical protein